MPKALLISEKPSLMRMIKKVYDNGVSCGYDVDFIALHGHVCDLAQPESYDPELKAWKLETLPFFPDSFMYNATDRELVKEISGMLKKTKYDALISATDPEREGQAIFYNLYNYLNCKLPVKRLWVKDLNDSAIKYAWEHLQDDQKDPFLMNLTSAAMSREYADQIIGINFSRAVTLTQKVLVPCGRVMTPVLELLADREEAIRNFTASKSYDVQATFKQGYTGVYKPDDESESGGAFPTKEEAEDFIKTLENDGVVKEFTKKRNTANAPLLYSTGELQSDASSTYSMTANDTLNILQELYEKKITSYPRTDCSFIPEGDADRMRGFVDKILPNIPELSGYSVPAATVVAYKKSKYVNTAKVKAHGAIIFYGENELDWDSLTDKQKKIATLIAKRVLATMMPPAVSDKYKIVTDVSGRQFITNLTESIDPGWKVLYKNEEKSSPVPAIKTGDKVDAEKFETLERVTRCPPRYSDGTLIKAMIYIGKTIDDKDLQQALKGETPEQGGIGTPATRAGIIEKLLKPISNGRATTYWVERKNNKFFVTDTGMAIAKLLKPYKFSSAILTAEWESRLSEMVDGNCSQDVFLSDLRGFVNESLEEIKATAKTVTTHVMAGVVCPVCGGRMIMSDRMYRCENSRSEGDGCHFSLSRNIGGAEIDEEDVISLCSGGVTKYYSMKGKSGKVFTARLKIKNEAGDLEFDFKHEDNSTDLTCPVCGKPMKKFEWGYSCSGYNKDDPDSCRFAVGYTIAGAKFTDKDIETLITKGKLLKSKTLIAKSGKKYTAAGLEIKDGTVRPFFEQPKDASDKKGNALICPNCGRPLVRMQGRISCSGYRDGCQFTVWQKIAGKTLSEQNMIDLIQKGETGKLKGFKSKKGKSFEANLLLKADGTVEFEF